LAVKNGGNFTIVDKITKADISVLYVERLCGEVMWRGYVERLCGEVMWRGYVERLCGEVVWRGYVERLCGEVMPARISRLNQCKFFIRKFFVHT
jgi:hypothetical protein